jgi:hydroxypyruvate isomerase
MNRRQFATSVAAMAAATLPVSRAPLAVAASVAPALRFQLSVMLWTVFPKLPFEQRLEKVAEAGYHYVELVEEYEEWLPEDFRSANSQRKQLGLKFDTIAAVKKGVANPTDREPFLSELGRLIPVAEQLECPAIIVLSGNRVAGLSHEQQHECCVETLQRAGEVASKKNITLLLENIDPEENPNYFLTSVAEGFEIVRKVDSPHVRFLYDLYHEQIAEGNLIEKLTKNINLVGVVHVADVPGRHAPGTGEINYANIFRTLAKLDYKGYVAMEFKAQGDTVSELKAARELAEQASL